MIAIRRDINCNKLTLCFTFSYSRGLTTNDKVYVPRWGQARPGWFLGLTAANSSHRASSEADTTLSATECDDGE